MDTVMVEFAAEQSASPAPDGVEIPAGMKAWHGGESAPADWDGGPVATRYWGLVKPGTLGVAWYRRVSGNGGDIIAYTPTPPTVSEVVADGMGEVERAFKAGWTKCWCRDPDIWTGSDGGKQAAWDAYRAAALSRLTAQPAPSSTWDLDAVRAIEAEFRGLTPRKRYTAIAEALSARGAPIPETLALMIQRVDDQYALAAQNSWRADQAEKALRALGYDEPTADKLLVPLSQPAPTPDPDVERDGLEWLGDQRRLSLYHYSPMYGDDDDQAVEWRVDRESGSINDREWETVGRGETPAAAIASARAAIAALRQPHAGGGE